MSRTLDLLSRCWPKRMAGQLIALLLLALVLSQAASLLFLAGERRTAVRAVEREQIAERTASVVRLVEESPPSLREQVVRTAGSRRLRFWIAETSAVPGDAAEPGAPLHHHLLMLLGPDRPREVRVVLADGGGLRRRARGDDEGEQEPKRSAAMGPAHGDAAFGHAAGPREQGPLGLAISVRLDDGRWLNARTGARAAPQWAWPSLISVGVSAAALSVIVVLMVRRITRPLDDLAAAADGIGRGEAVPSLAEEGPLDVRRTTRAFNRMNERLQRFVQDRTRMLAAISHDLRTPITSLRLRAEFVDNEETRAKILDTLAEMERMTEATLAFAREEAAGEETRVVDLAALVDSLCADLADVGMDVAFAGAPKTPYACRPTGLRRALRNLVENAAAYGERARVALERGDGGVRIVIDDDGPGIPEADFERVFQPFVRGEESRSRNTGGIGLGLSIARSVVRGHGGDVRLANRPEGGLRATVGLPAGAG